LNKSRVITVGSAAAVLALTAGAASATTTFVTSGDIKDGAVHKVDLSDGVKSDLSRAVTPTTGTKFRIAHYPNGAGSGAIATVSCGNTEEQSQKYVAISGGVQMLNADGDDVWTNDNNLNVADSFPGRMDWSTNTPKADRLDGWVVRFGDTTKGNQINVWAVCMRRSDDVQVQTNTY
jgi:hypothetical protein